MKSIPLAVAAVALGAAHAVAAPEPAAAAPCLDLPDPGGTLYVNVAVDAVAVFEVPGLCYDLVPVVTELANPDGMLVGITPDGTATAGFSLTPPPGFTGESVVQVDVDFGGTTQTYELAAWFGPLPVMSWGTTHLYPPLPTTEWVDVQIPGWSRSAAVTCAGHLYMLAGATRVGFGIPLPGSDMARAMADPWPTSGVAEFRVDLTCGTNYAPKETRSYFLSFGGTPPATGGGAQLAATGGEASPVAAALALAAIGSGILLVRRRRMTTP